MRSAGRSAPPMSPLRTSPGSASSTHTFKDGGRCERLRFTAEGERGWGARARRTPSGTHNQSSQKQPPPVPTCTGRGTRRAGPIAQLRVICSTTLPPKLCPISISGKSFSADRSLIRSAAALSRLWVPRRLLLTAAESPWQRRSATTTYNGFRRRKQAKAGELGGQKGGWVMARRPTTVVARVFLKPPGGDGQSVNQRRNRGTNLQTHRRGRQLHVTAACKGVASLRIAASFSSRLASQLQKRILGPSNIYKH